MKSKFYDERYSLEVYVDCDEDPPTVEVRLPSMVSLTPEAALRFGGAIVEAAYVCGMQELCAVNEQLRAEIEMLREEFCQHGEKR